LLVFKARSHYVAQTSLELTIFLSAEIIDMPYRAQLTSVFEMSLKIGTYVYRLGERKYLFKKKKS
jgi:hypothetical protein